MEDAINDYEKNPGAKVRLHKEKEMKQTTVDREVDKIIDGIARDLMEKHDRAVLGKYILNRRDEILAEKRKAAAMHEVSAEVIAHVQKNHVAKADPLPVGDPISAIHKSNASPVLAKNHYESLMRRVADASAAEIAKIKGKVPHVEHAQPDSSKDDDKDVNWLDDKEASAAHRCEQAAKAQGQHHGDNRPDRFSTRSEDNLNGEPRRLETQADRMNPKPLLNWPHTRAARRAALRHGNSSVATAATDSGAGHAERCLA
jgi:hypothetical protein